ncbi:MAG: hypothetical protein DRJ37_04760 [Thermoprotei archaeon]|nr:MAG: hypothetical protein DRJ37_04760 [Thermoprotei archaeon]
MPIYKCFVIIRLNNSEDIPFFDEFSRKHQVRLSLGDIIVAVDGRMLKTLIEQVKEKGRRISVESLSIFERTICLSS